MPSTYAGVLFRNQGEPVLHLDNPAGMAHECQRLGLDTIRGLNEKRYGHTQDPEILARIANYELAYRMQSAAPELIDLSDESDATLEAYGVNRDEKGYPTSRGGGSGGYAGPGLVDRGPRLAAMPARSGK